MKTLQEQVLQKIQNSFGDGVKMDFHDERWDGKHFYVDITSDKFIWKSRIDQSKMVYEVLDEFMQTGSIHALRMKCRVPNNINT
jgi:stress-induced morphogen